MLFLSSSLTSFHCLLRTHLLLPCVSSKRELHILFSSVTVASDAVAHSVAQSWEIQLSGPLAVKAHWTSLFHLAAVGGHGGQGDGKVVAPAGPRMGLLVLLF